MSNDFQNRVRGSKRQRRLGSAATGMARFILMLIADNADEFGFAYGSIGSLAFSAGCSTRCVQENLKRLEDLGELWILRSTGDGEDGWKVHRYLVALGQTKEELAGAFIECFDHNNNTTAEMLADELIYKQNNREWPEMYKPYRGEISAPPPADPAPPPADPAPKPSINHHVTKKNNGVDNLGTPEPLEIHGVPLYDYLDDENWGAMMVRVSEVYSGEGVEYIELDDSGDFVTGELYAPNSGFFRLIMSNLLPKRRSLNGAQRKEWMAHVRRAEQDPLYKRWMVVMALTNAAGLPVTVYFQYISNEVHFAKFVEGTWKPASNLQALTEIEGVGKMAIATPEQKVKLSLPERIAAAKEELGFDEL